MKKVSLFLFLLFVLGNISSKGQTNMLTGELDRFRISLDGPSSSRIENISLYIDSRSTDGYDGANTLPPSEGLNLGSQHMFSSYTYLEDGTDVFLIKDARPYDGKYYVDFPLYIDLNLIGAYKIFCTPPIQDINQTATIVRLIDKDYPDRFINLLEEDYLFTINSNELKIYKDRFIVRIYAACLFNKNATSKKWNDPGNWIGGLPGEGKDVRVDNCVIIPEGAEITIPPNFMYTVGTLLNSGEIIIEKNASLTVNNEAKMISVNNMY